MLAGSPLSLGEIIQQLNRLFTPERLIEILRRYPGFVKHQGCIADLDTLWEYDSALAGIAPFLREPLVAASTTSETGVVPTPIHPRGLAPDATPVMTGDRQQGPKRLFGTALSSQNIPEETLDGEFGDEPQTKSRRVAGGSLTSLLNAERALPEQHAAEWMTVNCGPEEPHYWEPSVDAQSFPQPNQFVDILNNEEENTPLIPYDGLWPAHYNAPAYLPNEAKSPPRQALPSPTSLAGSVEGEQDGSDA